MTQNNIFSLTSSESSALKRGLVRPVEKLLGLDGVADIYNASCSCYRSDPDSGFWNGILKAMDVRYEVSDHDLSLIPDSGPLVVVANHPYGGLEGVILASLLGRVRSDVKLMANSLLARVPELQNLLFSVNPFGGARAARENINTLRDSIEWIKNGNALGVFPSGEVSSLNLKLRSVTDPKWSTTVARIVRRTGANVLPVYFSGTNSRLFQAAGLVHPRLRTALLARELINKRSRTIELRVGKVISRSRLEQCVDDEQMMSLMRLRTYVMANRNSCCVCPEKVSVETRKEVPVVEGHGPEVMEREIAALNSGQKLFEQDDFIVCCAKKDAVPEIVREIGRLREITFRQVGEGTGGEIDLDRFDDYYLHLFVWSKSGREIVGAYRLGQTDVILNRFGKKGLYTNTLFKYRSQLLKNISPALEMGRSFVRPKYQKSYAPLMLLWRGIGAFVVKNPEYRNLFGPVSVNNGYQTFTRRLMMEFLRMNNFRSDLSRLVKAKTPMKDAKRRVTAGGETLSCIGSLDDLSEMVADIETSQREIPILLKQYLKLGGELLGFNIDPDFNDVLDGLILVDLSKTKPRMLERYMGKEGVKSFLDYHRNLRKKAVGSISVAHAFPV